MIEHFLWLNSVYDDISASMYMLQDVGEDWLVLYKGMLVKECEWYSLEHTGNVRVWGLSNNKDKPLNNAVSFYFKLGSQHTKHKTWKVFHVVLFTESAEVM